MLILQLTVVLHLQKNDMNINEFEINAHKVIDWIVDYYKNIEKYPVLSKSNPKDIFNQFSDFPPENSVDFDTIFAEFNEKIIPGITHWQHPDFFAYFPASSSFPSLLGEMLTSAIGAQCMSWQTSPAAAELEEKVMIWLRKMIGLPEYFEGVIQDTASTATLCSILSAREKFSNFSINHQGYENNKFTIYCSSEAHSSIEKAVKISGIGRSNMRKISTFDDFSINYFELDKQIEIDLEAGFKPLAIVAALGTTGSTAIDNLFEVGKIANKYNIWLHVDAAFAGSALILEQFRWMIKGIEFVDSFVFNPHKWLLTNFDCSAYFVKDKGALIQTFEILPEYLKTKNDNVVNNYRDWGIQLGRRFRALKLWMVIQSYGVKGLQEKIQFQLDLTEYFLKELKNIDNIEILAPVYFTLVCFRFNDNKLDESELNIINEKLHQTILEDSNLYFTHTKLNGKYTLRIVLGQNLLEKKNVDYLLSEIKKAVQDV